jgi:hypothetical protein
MIIERCGILNPAGFERRVEVLRERRWFCWLSLLLLILAGCSRAEPKIAYGTMRLVYYQEQEGPEERFSFFVLPEDDDGIEDVAELYLYHDGDGLAWHISSDDWVSYEDEGKVWVGTYSIAMVENGVLPRGQFRAVLADKGGERSERTFSFDAPEEPRYPFPFLYIGEGRYRIDSAYPEHYFICYDSQGIFLGAVPISAPEGELQSLNLPSNTRAVALWDDDSEYYISALTDVVSLSIQ